MGGRAGAAAGTEVKDCKMAEEEDPPSSSRGRQLHTDRACGVLRTTRKQLAAFCSLPRAYLSGASSWAQDLTCSANPVRRSAAGFLAMGQPTYSKDN